MAFILQVTGSILYYILSDGHIPHETSVPYYAEPEGVMQNLRKNKYTMEHISHFKQLQTLIAVMIELCKRSEIGSLRSELR